MYRHLLLMVCVAHLSEGFDINKCTKNTYTAGTSTRYNLECRNAEALDFSDLERQLTSYYIGTLKYHGNIRTITAHAFNRTNFLNRLFMLNVHVERIEPRAFSWLKLLQTLDLDSNELTTLDRDTFYGLADLTNLDLRRNHINGSLEGVFRHLNKLEFLYLQYNNITSIRNTFAGLSKLKTLYLSYNQIKDLPGNVFSDLSNLDRLQLEYNEISSIDKTAFEHVTTLKFLNLKFNRLTTLPVGCFYDLKGLIQLDMSRNELGTHNISYFTGLTGLQKLNLSFNALENFDNRLYYPLVKLEELNIDRNNISDLKYADLLEHMPRLKSLTLGHNLFSCEFLLEFTKYLGRMNSPLVIETLEHIKYEQNIHGIGCEFTTTISAIKTTSVTKIDSTTTMLTSEITTEEATYSPKDFDQKNTTSSSAEIKSEQIHEQLNNCGTLEKHHSLLVIVLVLLSLILVVCVGYFAWKLSVHNKQKYLMNVRYVEDKVDLI